MAAKDRLTDPNGNPIPFTCRNRRYQTDIHRGHPHGNAGQARGSVLPTPLIAAGGYTLWLEHVLEPASDDRVYWLMWYDHAGTPTIPLSSVFGRGELSEMLARLADFVP